MLASGRHIIQEVVAINYCETENEDGDKTINADLLDGTVLLITKPNPSKLAELRKGASDESYHLKHSDAELPEPILYPLGYLKATGKESIVPPLGLSHGFANLFFIRCLSVLLSYRYSLSVSNSQKNSASVAFRNRTLEIHSCASVVLLNGRSIE